VILGIESRVAAGRSSISRAIRIQTANWVYNFCGTAIAFDNEWPVSLDFLSLVSGKMEEGAAMLPPWS
jgi:hypothetical protein